MLSEKSEKMQHMWTGCYEKKTIREQEWDFGNKKYGFLGEETNLPSMRIPNNLCGYSTLKERQQNSSLIKCELCVVTSFQRVECGKGREERLTLHDNHYLSQAIKANIHSHNHIDRMRPLQWHDENYMPPLQSSSH